MRIGLGYVLGVKEEEVKALVAERERGGRYADAGDLAARSGAGATRSSGSRGRAPATSLPRREALWQMGVVTPGQRGRRAACSSSLPLRGARGARAARADARGSGCVADYGSFRISIAEHPMALLRPDLPGGGRCRAAASSALAARQRV